jgi:hypothetical protein
VAIERTSAPWAIRCPKPVAARSHGVGVQRVEVPGYADERTNATTSASVALGRGRPPTILGRDVEVSPPFDDEFPLQAESMFMTMTASGSR